VSCPAIEKGDPSAYEQCNDGNNDVKKKDWQNEESYDKKRQNQDTKDNYLEKERKMVPKWKTEK
jgi:hypothetical protein